MRFAIVTLCVVGAILGSGCGRDPASVPSDDASEKGGRAAPDVSVEPGVRDPSAVSPPVGTVPGEYRVIDTWAGTGINGATPDGTPLRNAELSTPMDVAFAPDGTAYIVDWNNHRILEVRQGRHYTVVGNGTLGAAQDGPTVDLAETPELEGGLNHPTDVTFDPQGRLILATWHNSKVVRCDLVSQTKVRLVGLDSEETNGNRCWNGDDNPAIESCLDLPVSVGFDAMGNLYIADQKNLRIRKVTPVNGEISSSQTVGDLSGIETVVGTGYRGPSGTGSYNGNGLPGPETHLNAPGGQSAPPSSKILVRPDGEVYFADSVNNVVRRLGTDGIVHAVAGGGLGVDPVTGIPLRGYTGDGGPATGATLYFPVDVAMDSRGNLYIADCFNHSIRKVDANGIITTFAGRGERNVSVPVRDNVPPTEEWLDRPFGVAVDADDNVYIADTYHGRIRIVRK